jgi:hypothetical protein
MSNDIEIDTSKLNDMIAQLQDALGHAGKPADLSDIVRDETRRLAEGIVRITPPYDRAEGEAAIENEINSLFSEASPDLIRGITEGFSRRVNRKRVTTNVDTEITKKDGTKLRLKWDNVLKSAPRTKMQEIHYLAKNARGKVYMRRLNEAGVWKARNVVPHGASKRYIKYVKKHVGRWKASWSKVIVKLGGKRPTHWIARHIDNHPHAVADTEGLMNGSFPKVTFGSRSPGVGRQRSIVQNAVRIRGEAMAKRIKLILSGYSRDLSKNMRIQARAKRTH